MDIKILGKDLTATEAIKELPLWNVTSIAFWDDITFFISLLKFGDIVINSFSIFSEINTILLSNKFFILFIYIFLYSLDYIIIFNLTC